jgi:hypothetical protein
LGVGNPSSPRPPGPVFGRRKRGNNSNIDGIDNDNDNECDFGLEYRNKIVAKLVGSLGFSKESDDRTYLLTAVQSLIKMNNELADGLKPYFLSRKLPTLSTAIELLRIDFPSVTVETDTSIEQVSFTTTPALVLKEFPLFPPIPSVLQDILVFKCEDQRLLPDYRTLFDMIVGILHPNLQVGALKVLKSHLDLAHISLGQMMEWAVVEPARAVLLLNRLFDTDIKLPDIEQCRIIENASAGIDSLAKNSVCLKCHAPLSSHFGTRYVCADPPGGTVKGRFLCSESIKLMVGNQSFGDVSHVYSTHCQHDEVVLENFVSFFKKSQNVSRSNLDHLVGTKEKLKDVEQYWLHTRESDFVSKIDFLEKNYSFFISRAPTMIFTGTRIVAEAMYSRLMNQGWECDVLHATTPPDERELTVQSCRTGDLKVLIVTDSIARVEIGLYNAPLIINYDMPVTSNGNADYETYLKRIGYTGRDGRKGVVLNLVDNHKSVESLIAKQGQTMIQKINDVDKIRH